MPRPTSGPSWTRPSTMASWRGRRGRPPRSWAPDVGPAPSPAAADAGLAGTAEGPAPARRRRSRVGAPYFLVVPLLAVVAWEVVARLKLLPPLLFPSATTILFTLLDTLTGRWGTSEWYSGQWHVHAL